MEMQPSPSANAASEVPPFTPSHHLKDRLLSFTDILLSNIQEWNKPHPPLPPPPPPISFSGSSRFLKGRFPHRTAEISESLSTFFSSIEALSDACKYGNDTGQLQFDRSLCQFESGTCENDAITSIHRAMDNCSTPHSASRQPAGICPDSQGSGAVQCREHTDFIKESSGDRRADVSAKCMELEKEYVHPSAANSAQVQSLRGDLQTVNHLHNDLEAQECNSDSLKTYIAGNLEYTQQDLDRSTSKLELVGATPSGDFKLNADARDLEEGELSEGLPEDEQGHIIEENSLEGRSYKEGENANHDDVRHGTKEGCFSHDQPISKVIESETDDEMDEPISLFVSRYRARSLNMNNKKSGVNSKLNIGKSSRKTQNPEQVQRTLNNASCLSSGSTGNTEKCRLTESLIDVMPDAFNKRETDEATKMSSVMHMHQDCGERKLPENSNESSLAMVDGSHFPTAEAEKDVQELASQVVVSKKKKRGPLTEARRKKKQRAKRKAEERKQAKLGICKLKIKPCFETLERKKRTCVLYVQGKCGKGTSCTFSHDVTPKTKSEMCKYFVRNCCLKGSDCPYSHDLSSFPCKYFHMRQRCVNGDLCRFSHEPMSEEAKQAFLQRIEGKQVHQVGNGLQHASLDHVTPWKFPPLESPYTRKAELSINENDAKTPLSLKSNIGSDHDANKLGMASSLGVPSPRTGEPSPSSSDNVFVLSQARRAKAEVFLKAQLDNNRLLPRPRLPMVVQNLEQTSCTHKQLSSTISIEQPATIRVSSMSASSKSNANALHLHHSSHQNNRPEEPLIGSLAEKRVSSESPSLLDLLLRPH